MMKSDSEDSLKLPAMEKIRLRSAAESMKSSVDEKNNNQENSEDTKLLENESPKKILCCTSYIQFLSVVLIILTIMLTVMLVLMGVRLYKKHNEEIQFCMRPECIELASDLMKIMDLSTDPCNNFYHYACGRFKRTSYIPPDTNKVSQFSKVERATKTSIKKILEKPGSSFKSTNYSEAVMKAKTYFHICMNISANDDMGVEPLLKWVSSIGDWVIDTTSEHWKFEKFHLEKSLAKMLTSGIQGFFQISVELHRKNNSVQNIYLDKGGLSFGNALYYVYKNASTYRGIYHNYYTTVMDYIGRNSNESSSVAMKLWDFETSLAQLIFASPISEKKSDELIKKISLDNLQKMVDPSEKVLNMSLFLDTLLGKDINRTYVQIVSDSEMFFQGLGAVLSNTSTETLVDYLIWNAIQSVAAYQPFAIRYAQQTMMSSLYDGVKEPALWKKCVGRTQSILPDVVEALFIEETFTNETKKKVEVFLKHIVHQFKEILSHLHWMDEPTKTTAKEKVDAMSYHIGYPEYLMDAKVLDQTYSQLKVGHKNSFENFIFGLQFIAAKALGKINNLPDHEKWSMAVTDANAYYRPDKNQMVFPAGILTKPFYDYDAPMAMNFGSIGFILGHELTHGFDNLGSKYDKFGHKNNWWSNDSLARFKEQQKCLVHQYNQYEVGDDNIKGKLTLGENIADNGGITTSYKAYMHWKKLHNLEDVPTMLPGINATDVQLFFLSFAQTWCSYYTPEYAQESIKEDPHSYAKYRVIGTLSNMVEFSNAYGCPMNSPMNPEIKCDMW